jgi:small redox-active disulfide protein 2
MTKIQVLGTGCPKCEETAENAKAAAASLGIDIDLEKVAELSEIAKFRVMFTPALAVNGEVKVAGRVPTAEEIKPWLIA